MLRKRIAVLMAAALLALLPGAAMADNGDRGDFLLKVRGDVVVASGQSAGTVVVIDGNLLVEGTVRDTVVVISGTATIAGRVEDNVVVISGDLVLRSSADVKDVTLINSDLERASGATVRGEVRERDRLVWGLGAVFSIVLWLGMTIGVIAGGLVFAAVGGRQLGVAARSLTGRVPASILAALGLWIALPILAALVFATVVGIPLAIGILVFLLPALWFLGYLAAGTRLGLALTGRMGRETGLHPYSAAFLGLLILQLVFLVPGLGFLIVALAGLWGGGALVLMAWDAARSRGDGAPAATAPPPEATPAA
jgi:hypothetical protein